MNKFSATVFLALVATGSSVLVAEARPAYALKEDKPCAYCHTSARGGERGFRGQYYGANGLTFEYYLEAQEATLAGVQKDVTGPDSKPTLGYTGNVLGPAAPQVQLAALRGPVVVIFFDGAADTAKSAMKQIYPLRKAYGKKVTFVGVAKTDVEGALKLTEAFEASIRVLPDPKGAAIAKYAATKGLDFAVIGERGDFVKLFEGVSKANFEEAIQVLTTKLGQTAPTFDTSTLSAKPVRGNTL